MRISQFPTLAVCMSVCVRKPSGIDDGPHFLLCVGETRMSMQLCGIGSNEPYHTSTPYQLTHNVLYPVYTWSSKERDFVLF